MLHWPVACRCGFRRSPHEVAFQPSLEAPNAQCSIGFQPVFFAVSESAARSSELCAKIRGKPWAESSGPLVLR